MIVIAISSTNCFPLIGTDGFHGVCRAAAIGHSPEIRQTPLCCSPPVGPGRGAHAARRWGGRSAARGVLGKGEGEKNPPGLLPKNTTRCLFYSTWGSPGSCCLPWSPAAARCWPCHLQCWPWHPWRRPCCPWCSAASSGDPARHLCRTRGSCFPRNVLFFGLFSPKVQPVRRLTPLGTAGLISSPWQLFMLLSGNYSFA